MMAGSIAILVFVVNYVGWHPSGDRGIGLDCTMCGIFFIVFLCICGAPVPGSYLCGAGLA